MAKTETIDFKSFIRNDWKKEIKRVAPGTRVIQSTPGALVLLVPKLAFASSMDSTFGNVHGAIMNAFDAGVVLIIIFAGAAWAFGHRTKAIEIIIGVSCGYILARHAVDIRDFLKQI